MAPASISPHAASPASAAPPAPAPGRALWIVLDSVGCGHAPDAADFGDVGADTLGHIYERTPGFALPTLESLGLDALRRGAAGAADWDAGPAPARGARAGWMREVSAGKDTTTGHWELAGATTREAFSVFDQFPPRIVAPIQEAAGVEFIGNFAASGTTIIADLGAEHVATGKPILYTSADSVIQIAAHEEVVPLERLYAICKAARKVADAERIGRVIARPFLGEAGDFLRTKNRKDFSLQPPRTVLNEIADAGLPVIGVGKISDIFAASGITESDPTKTNDAGMAAMDRLIGAGAAAAGGLIFVNLVDFDMHFGHRRDVPGYAQCLREFDAWLAGFLDGPWAEKSGPRDIIAITADHGNDPTWTGTDHTREQVPLIIVPGAGAGEGGAPLPHPAGPWIGARESFADLGASLCSWVAGSEWPGDGRSFL